MGVKDLSSFARSGIIKGVVGITRSQDDPNILQGVTIQGTGYKLRFSNPVHVTNDLEIENLAEAIEIEIVKSNLLEWNCVYGKSTEVNLFERIPWCKDFILDHSKSAQLRCLLLRALWSVTVNDSLMMDNLDIADVLRLISSNLSELICACSQRIRNENESEARFAFTLIIIHLIYLRDTTTCLIEKSAEVSLKSCSYDWDVYPKMLPGDDGKLILQLGSDNIITSAPYRYNIVTYHREGVVFLSLLLQRCIFSIVKGISSGVGPLLYGPAACGKLSTVKGCSELCGTMLETFDCQLLKAKSESYAEKGKSQGAYNSIIQGFLGSGRWLCMSNFQILSAQELSVFASVLIQIQHAIKQGHPVISWNGNKVRLSRESYLVCTMTSSKPMPFKFMKSTLGIFSSCNQVPVPSINMIGKSLGNCLSP